MQLYRISSLAAATLMAANTVASGQESVSAFYKGKEIKIIVGSGAGGGYDAYARFAAKFMGQHIPGNPSLSVQNMPGAGGLRATNFLYNIAPKDGTYIAHIQRTMPSHKVLGLPGAQFDPERFTWLGSLNNEVIVCVARKEAPVKTAQDLFSKEYIVGGAGAAADSETVPSILANILGMKIKIISGYPSSTETAFAIDRGEVDGYCGSYSSVTTQQKRWFTKDGNMVNFLVQVSNKKHPELSDVPLAIDFAKSEDDRRLMELNDSRLVMGRPFVAPPNIPADRAAALVKAFWDMANDKAFRAMALKLDRELNPVPGPEVKALVERITKVDAKLIARLKEALVYKGPVTKAKIKMLRVSGAVADTQIGGRTIAIRDSAGKSFSAAISGSQTNVTIAGSKSDRGKIAVGMMCTIEATGDGAQAASVECK